jgi:hypothetical protein
MPAIERSTVNELYQDLLSSGWGHTSEEPSLVKEFVPSDYPFLRENISQARMNVIIISLRMNENGEYESDISSDYADQCIIERYIIPFNSSEVFTTIKPLIFDVLDPNGDDKYRIFITYQEQEGFAYIQFDRLIVLPSDIEYINKSAEVHWQLGVAFDLFFTTFGNDSYSYFLDGEEYSNSLDWLFSFMNKMHDLHPECVWKRDAKHESDVKEDEEGDGEDDVITAVKNLQKLAEQGDAEAQWKLALCYDNSEGVGVLHDSGKAAYWYEKAAEQGHGDAANYLAISYRDGDGVQKDVDKAVFWFEKATEFGNIEAPGTLAAMYQDGKEVPQDDEKAGYWIQTAANMGNTEAQNYIKSLQMSESTIDKVILNLLTPGMTRANGHSKS